MQKWCYRGVSCSSPCGIHAHFVKKGSVCWRVFPMFFHPLGLGSFAVSFLGSIQHAVLGGAPELHVCDVPNGARKG